MEPNITKEVIFSYFAGACTTLQKTLIEEWAKEPVNRELFFDWLYEWEKTHVQYQVDLEAGLERHRAWVESLSETEVAPLFEPRPVKHLFPWRMFAAVCVLLASLLAGWLARDLIIYSTYETAFGEIKKITLSDGSKVVLNANSVFRVPRFGFGKTTREVFLAGEASFDVIHTTDNTRFVVQTQSNMDVEVLGTEFNVYARSSGSRVVLNTGQIQLHYSEGNKKQRLTMKPGDLATMDMKGKVVMAHTAQPQNFSAWKYHRFVFEDQPFREICDRLEETFGNKIIITGQTLANQAISGSFTALDAEELLDMLSLAGNFKYQNKDGQIIISEDEASSIQADSSQN
jgi:transmembrane sensor